MKAGSFFHFSIILSWSVIFNLLNPFTGNFKVFLRGIPGFLYKFMQNQNLISDNSTEKRSTYTFFSLCTDFKKSLPHWSSERHTKVRAENLHSFSDSCIMSSDSNRPLFDPISDLFIKIPDLPFHDINLTYLLSLSIKMVDLAFQSEIVVQSIPTPTPPT
jgi:hypothetical protein